VNAYSKSPTERKTTKRQSRLRFQILNSFVDSGMTDLSRAELAVLADSLPRHEAGRDRPSLAR
jgi:hypothetical protein